MADEEQPAAPAAGTYDPATLNTIIQQLMQPQQQPQPLVPQASPHEGRSWASLLGEAAGGGEQYGTPEQRESGGLRALASLGTNMMANSGWAPLRTPMGQILATGLQGAQQSVGESQSVVAAQAAAQQQYAEKQQEMGLERLKVALPLLRMQQGAGIPNLLAGGGGAPGTNVAQGGSIADPLAALPKDQALAAIVQRESGGQNIPTAILGPDGKPASTATGYYQMLDGTWQEAAALAGIKNPPARAMDASKAQQDAAASALYDKYKLMPWAKSAPVAPTTTAAAPPATATPPAPYKVASIGATPPPPSSGPIAPATGTPSADDTFFPTPNVSTSPTLRGPGSPVPPAPSPTTTVAANAPAPQTPTQADQPPAPTGPMTIEQYRALHPSNIDPSTFTVTPDSKALAQAEAERQTAAQNLQQARLAGDNAAANKALNAATEASSKIATLQQQAQVETAKMQMEAQNKAEALTQQGYNDEMTRQQQAQLKAQELAQQAAEADKQRQNAIEIERLKAGWTSTQHQQDTDMKVGTDQLTGMQAQAQKAEALQPMLQQLVPLLKDPKAPEGVVGQFLASHTEWLPTLTALGLDPKTANIAQLVKGLTDYLSLDLKPTGTGALRNQELPMLQGLFANLGQSKQTQQQALSRILNYTQRVKNEYDMATENFGAVDPKTNQPNYKILYKNIDAPMQLDENGTRTGGGLGPVVPEAPAPVANPNPGQLEAARRYQKYVANLSSGMPYNTYERQGDGSLQRVLKIRD